VAPHGAERTLRFPFAPKPPGATPIAVSVADGGDPTPSCPRGGELTLQDLSAVVMESCSRDELVAGSGPQIGNRFHCRPKIDLFSCHDATRLVDVTRRSDSFADELGCGSQESGSILLRAHCLCGEDHGRRLNGSLPWSASRWGEMHSVGLGGRDQSADSAAGRSSFDWRSSALHSFAAHRWSPGQSCARSSSSASSARRTTAVCSMCARSSSRPISPSRACRLARTRTIPIATRCRRCSCCTASRRTRAAATPRSSTVSRRPRRAVGRTRTPLHCCRGTRSAFATGTWRPISRHARR
jgi:hypothetical protein